MGSGLWICKAPSLRYNWIKVQTNIFENKLGFLTDLVTLKLECLLFYWVKVSATLQDSPRADRCSISCFYKNPYKPYIF